MAVDSLVGWLPLNSDSIHIEWSMFEWFDGINDDCIIEIQGGVPLRQQIFIYVHLNVSRTKWKKLDFAILDSDPSMRLNYSAIWIILFAREKMKFIIWHWRHSSHHLPDIHCKSTAHIHIHENRQYDAICNANKSRKTFSFRFEMVSMEKYHQILLEYVRRRYWWGGRANEFLRARLEGKHKNTMSGGCDCDDTSKKSDERKNEEKQNSSTHSFRRNDGIMATHQ